MSDQETYTETLNLVLQERTADLIQHGSSAVAGEEPGDEPDDHDDHDESDEGLRREIGNEQRRRVHSHDRSYPGSPQNGIYDLVFTNESRGPHGSFHVRQISHTVIITDIILSGVTYLAKHTHVLHVAYDACRSYHARVLARPSCISAFGE